MPTFHLGEDNGCLECGATVDHLINEHGRDPKAAGGWTVEERQGMHRAYHEVMADHWNHTHES